MRPLSTDGESTGSKCKLVNLGQLWKLVKIESFLRRNTKLCNSIKFLANSTFRILLFSFLGFLTNLEEVQY